MGKDAVVLNNYIGVASRTVVAVARDLRVFDIGLYCQGRGDKSSRQCFTGNG